MRNQTSKADQNGASTPLWSKTKTPNLIRYNPSDTYYMRVRVAGKLHVKSLETDVYSTAQARLPDYVKPLRAAIGAMEQVRRGKMTFGEALEAYRARVAA
ncbi:MAG TPA: hypothetical protein VM680_09025, partial [Verrucomicrobiae bacterium]|nr:hypothetical protein [Verrucomicrobiae bacterium]